MKPPEIQDEPPEDGSPGRAAKKPADNPAARRAARLRANLVRRKQAPNSPASDPDDKGDKEL